MAYELWPALVEELGPATEYRRSGGVYVIMGDEPIEPTQIREFRRKHGYTAEELSPEECRKLIPGLRADVKGGLFSPKSAHINPIVTMKLLARAAVRTGVEIREHCAATAIRTRAGVIEGVETDCGRIDAPFVVDAAGPWAASVGKMVDVQIPVDPRRIQILLSEAIPPLYSHIWAGNSMYARQALSGQLHFGAMGPAWETGGWSIDRSVTLPTMQRIAGRMVELVPGLGEVRVLRSWAGVLAVSTDGVPIVGMCREPHGFVIGTGFGGNGFVTGPAVGRIITDLICTGAFSHHNLDLRRVSPARFTGHTARSSGTG
jgi:sarcosine oxidase subunit beta